MAASKRTNAGGGANGLKEDEVVARLVPDPADPPEAIRLAGYLGRSTRRGFWRLYQTLELNEYVEVAEDDILHSEPLGGREGPSRGTVLWVRQDATLQHTRTESVRAQADFLQGDITGGFLSGVELSGAEAALFAARKRTNKCLTWGCCRVGKVEESAEESLFGRREFLEGDIVGLFLTEALAEEGVAMRNHRTHRCLTFGCCPEPGVSRRHCSLDK